MYTTIYQMKKYKNNSHNENYHISSNLINDDYDNKLISDIYYHNKLNSLDINKLNKEPYINNESTNYTYKEKLLTNDKNNMPL